MLPNNAPDFKRLLLRAHETSIRSYLRFADAIRSRCNAIATGRHGCPTKSCLVWPIVSHC